MSTHKCMQFHRAANQGGRMNPRQAPRERESTPEYGDLAETSNEEDSQAVKTFTPCREVLLHSCFLDGWRSNNCQPSAVDPNQPLPSTNLL